MANPTLATLNVQTSGSSPVGFVTQTWIVNGTPTTVYVQGAALFDPASGQPSIIDANGLHVVPSFGQVVSSGVVSNTNIGSGASATLASPTPVTNGKAGTLQHAIFTSTQPVLWTLQKLNNAGTPTSISSFITDANRTFDFKPGVPNEVATDLATGTNVLFQAIAQNLSTNTSVAASAYASFSWAEN